jgi:hypothetical protein
MGSHDEEKGTAVRERRGEGYGAVAAWIARDPDNETFVFRKFDELGARNLLYLQSEVLELEHKLEEFDRSMVDSHSSKKVNMILADMSWEEFTGQLEADETEARARMRLITDIRAKIKEYREFQRDTKANGYVTADRENRRSTTTPAEYRQSRSTPTASN